MIDKLEWNEEVVRIVFGIILDKNNMGIETN